MAKTQDFFDAIHCETVAFEYNEAIREHAIYETPLVCDTKYSVAQRELGHSLSVDTALMILYHFLMKHRKDYEICIGKLNRREIVLSKKYHIFVKLCQKLDPDSRLYSCSSKMITHA